MKLNKLMFLNKGDNFYYKGSKAQIVWKEFVEFLIQKADNKVNPPTPNIYFKSFSVFFNIFF